MWMALLWMWCTRTVWHAWHRRGGRLCRGLLETLVNAPPTAAMVGARTANIPYMLLHCYNICVDGIDV